MKEIEERGIIQTARGMKKHLKEAMNCLKAVISLADAIETIERGTKFVLPQKNCQNCTHVSVCEIYQPRARILIEHVFFCGCQDADALELAGAIAHACTRYESRTEQIKSRAKAVYERQSREVAA